MSLITIVDYGMGNLGSIQNMFKRIGVKTNVTSDPVVILKATKLLFPGVGAFDTAMERLNTSSLRDVLEKKVVIDKVPVLGICLGMQLLTNGSEEGTLPGLGWIPASTKRFPRSSKLKIPHMGWNLVHPANPSPLTDSFQGETRFYFVHSYYVQVQHRENSILKTVYGIEFDSAIQHENIYGAQFHPEKSHRFGMRLFKNFAEL